MLTASHLIDDIRYTFRTLRLNPGFACVAVLSLALGIGANTAIFSLIDAVLLRALPVTEPDRLVLLSDPASSGVSMGTETGVRSLFTYEEFVQLRDRNGVFSGMFAAESNPGRLNIRIGGGAVEEARGKLVSGEYFDVLGVRPVLGRPFTSAEDRSPVMRQWLLAAIVCVVLGCSSAAVAQEPASPVFADGGSRAVELCGVYFVEAWNFNGRARDVLAGATAAVSLPIHGRWDANVELAGIRVAQHGPDAVVGGVFALVRRRLAQRRRMTLFVDGGFGVSYASQIVPERGTRFNYLLEAGGGVSQRFGRRTGGLVDLRLFHLSNNSLNGSNHNPDIEALGGHVGVFILF